MDDIHSKTALHAFGDPIRLLQERVSGLTVRVTRLEALVLNPPAGPADGSGGECVFLFNRAAKGIYFNGRFLTRDIQARLLFKLLQRHTESPGRALEYREFRRDRELFPGSNSANFELRLRRLAERLGRFTDRVALVKLEPGRFRLRASGPIRLQEE